MNSICRIKSCSKTREKESTLCGMHRWRWKKYNSYDLPAKIMNPEGILKICKIHGELGLEEVYKSKSSSGYRIWICKVCKLESNKRHLKKNPEQTKKRRGQYEKGRKKYDESSESYNSIVYRLKNKFNLTLEQYETMINNQNNLCAICKEEETSKRRRKLVIDHCHNTGKVRALLCNFCNVILGMSKESIPRLEACIQYITKHSQS